jgi:hypothetical protein
MINFFVLNFVYKFFNHCLGDLPSILLKVSTKVERDANPHSVAILSITCLVLMDCNLRFASAMRIVFTISKKFFFKCALMAVEILLWFIPVSCESVTRVFE